MPADALQEWMTHLLHRRGALDGDPSLHDEIAEHISGNDRLSPAEQLEIYREQYWLRHTSSLVEDFPGLGGIIGQADWERLVEKYLVRPPTSFTLRDLGRDLPSAVEAATWLPHHEVCVDMARLEWGYIEIFDATDAEALDAARLASLTDEDWERARIGFAPAFRLLRVDYPVAELRRRLRDRPDDSVSIPGRDPHGLVLYRDRHRNLRHARPSPGAFALLEELWTGAPLVSACERTVERLPEEHDAIASGIGAWFEDWGKRGWIEKVEV